jgi:Ca2+-binding RTX toxin-like protein
MEAAGYGPQGWGENIAYVSGTLSEATVRRLHTLLMDSPGHRANIERAGFEEVGIGLKQGTIDGRAVVFVTQAFGTPNAQERAEADDLGTVVATPTPPSTPLRKTFVGNEGHNKLVGNAAANILKGKGGNDKLNGNGGKDLLFGGDGRDTFVFDKTHEANGDRIADFTKGWDKINLRGIDANTEIAGNQAFTFLGRGSYSGKPGELKSYVSGGKTYIAGDTNGDFVSDFKIKLAGLHQFSAGDFVL